MTDKELLELAAKAAGIGVKWEESHGCFWVEIGQGLPINEWNPRKDDGDALRLAVDLRLKIIPGKHPGDGCTVESQRKGIADCTAFRDDKREQMRLAIVRVAAEIGKAMP